jgi:alpha-amylase/alpha-mannosidase (GH57 family)
MANVIPAHRTLRYDPVKRSGQVDIITTPYYHPILPLIYDSDLARISQPHDNLPSRYPYPQDANAQVVKAVTMYREIFGVPPTGMWPGEGSLAQAVLPILRANGILWTASDVKVLVRSEPQDQPNTSPYRFPAGTTPGGKSQSMAVVFRDTELSDRIGFKYQNYSGEEAAEDFVRTILSRAPRIGEEDVLVTVILDGENAWEWYRHDVDGKEFLHALYRKLSVLFQRRQVMTVTTTEYLTGNPGRQIPSHPVEKLPAMRSLWPGSWINGNYDTWIGEEEENRAWEYLLRTRQDLERSMVAQPDPSAPPPKRGTRAWYAYNAWESMYAAEGSDWFWWYGNDQSAPAGDTPFDNAFRLHLNNVYKFSQLAGSSIRSPGFDPIIYETGGSTGSQGVMAQSRGEFQTVTFVCDASATTVPDALYIVGNIRQLAEWTPNVVRMYDDGTHGDATAGDGLWSLSLPVPVGEEIHFKFTNSGKRGEWVPGEEFPSGNRIYHLTRKTAGNIPIHTIFGQR